MTLRNIYCSFFKENSSATLSQNVLSLSCHFGTKPQAAVVVVDEQGDVMDSNTTYYGPITLKTSDTTESKQLYIYQPWVQYVCSHLRVRGGRKHHGAWCDPLQEAHEDQHQHVHPQPIGIRRTDLFCHVHLSSSSSKREQQK